jgi:hypothetical protein
MSPILRNIKKPLGSVLFVLMISSCAPTQRSGMVVDPETGLQFGSVVEKNIVVDSSQFPNNKLKIRLRNVSGDPAFDLSGLTSQLENAYRSKGYDITTGNDNGLMLDVNVTYSGQTSSNMASQYGFLGGSIGGIGGSQVGRNTTLGAAGGVIAGATLGSIVGSYVTDDTYIVVAHVTLGVKEAGEGETKKKIVFSSSETKTQTTEQGFQPFRQTITTGVSVYAGGRNISQGQIAGEVRNRFRRILSDIL